VGVCISEYTYCYIQDVDMFIICNVETDSNLVTHCVVPMEENCRGGGGGPYGI